MARHGNRVTGCARQLPCSKRVATHVGFSPRPARCAPPFVTGSSRAFRACSFSLLLSSLAVTAMAWSGVFVTGKSLERRQLLRMCDAFWSGLEVLPCFPFPHPRFSASRYVGERPSFSCTDEYSSLPQLADFFCCRRYFYGPLYLTATVSVKTLTILFSITRHRCSRQTLPMRGSVSPGTEFTPTSEIELRAP